MGILIGEDIILTSAHNLIFSQLEDGNIINYKPHDITFNLLSNGYLEILEPINCEIDTIIYSNFFKDFKFIKNQEINSKIVKENDLSNGKNSKAFNVYGNSNDLSIINNNFGNSNEYKSKSSDYTSCIGNVRNLSKKLNVNNISEIPLEEDYAIIFTEVNLGSEIIKIFCDKDTKLYNDLNNIDEESKIFRVFENHINFINELENSDHNKFQNSKISMISSIKYHRNLLGVPQYVYGYHLNDLNNKIYKSKKQKKLEDIKNKCKITLPEAKYRKLVSSYDPLSEDNDIENSRTSMKNQKWEKEFNHCLFINYDKNSNKKHLRNAHLDNLMKLMNFNCQEFYSEGKLVQCEARGKLCSLLYEKLRKTKENIDFNNINNPRYEVNNEKTTPYFNRQHREKDEKSNKDDLFHIENRMDLNISKLNLSSPDISDEIDSYAKNINADIIFNKIFTDKIEEILKYSFSEIIDLELSANKKDLELQNGKNDESVLSIENKIKQNNYQNDSILNKNKSRKQSFVDELLSKNLHSTLNQMKDLYVSNKNRITNYGFNSTGKLDILKKFNLLLI